MINRALLTSWSRLFFAIMALTVMMLIFNFSGQKAVQSGQTSLVVTERLCRSLLPNYRLQPTEVQKTIIDTYDFYVRKGAHFCIFACLGFCVYGFLCSFKLSIRFRFWMAELFCLLYAASDEWHQSFSAGRHPGVEDVLLDSLGAFCAITVFWMLTKEKRGVKEHGSQ